MPGWLSNFFYLLVFNVLLTPKQYGYLPFSLFNDSGYFSCNSKSFKDIISKRNLVYFELPAADGEENTKKIEEIEKAVRRLSATADTTKIIKVHFSAINTYGQFVRLVNIMVIEMQEYYVYCNDEFYAWQEQR